MRLKRLELQGFKSFMDRTILNFEPGITGVVGPNGCGKSNIVDAILWVMGEQSPKHLRGESMSDVIFNGSDSKGASGMAEVSLVLDKGGVALSPAFASFDRGDEISITRRLFRDGVAEFLINKVPCRLKDVHELFMDTGVGRRAYSIIEQGQIDRMINVKPEERRGLFEEVAGITKYKIKRREAERKLEQTQANMLRIHDIIAELEKQIRSLKVQAARAKKFRELKTELEEIDLFLSGRKLFDLVRRADELQSRHEIIVNSQAEAEARLAESDARITEVDIQRLDKERAISALAGEERDLSLRVQKLESEETLWLERKKHLVEGLEGARRESSQLQERITTLEAQGAGLEEQLTQLQDQLYEMQEELTLAETQLRDKERTLRELQQTRDSLQNKRSQLEQKAASLEKSVEYAAAREAECEQIQGGLNQKLTDIVVQLEQQRARLTEADEKVTASKQRAEDAEAQIERVVSDVQVSSRQLTQSEEALFSAREEFHGLKSRLTSLQELQENLEGYSPTAREILLKLQSEAETARPFAEILQPEAGLEEALEILLGTEMNTLVVSSSHQAERLVRLISEQNLERVKVIATEDLKGVSLQPVPKGTGSNIEGASSLLSRLRIEPGFEPVVEAFLGNVFLCDATEKLFELRRQHPDYTFLSLDTRTVGYDDRALSSGTPPTKVGVFARRREIDELQAKCAEQDTKVKELEAQRQMLLENLKSQEKLHDEWKGTLSSLHVEAMELRKEREKIQWEVQRTDRDYSALGAESAKNIENLSRLREQKEAAAGQLEGLRTELTQVVQSIEAAAEGLRQSETALEQVREHLGTKKDEISELKSEVNLFEERRRQNRSELENSRRRAEHLNQQQVSATTEIESMDSQMSSMRNQREEATARRNETLVLLADAQNEFQQICHELADLRTTTEQAHRQREELLKELNEVELALADVRSQTERLQSVCEERYQKRAIALNEATFIDLERIPIFQAELDAAWDTLSETQREQRLSEHLESIRQKVNRYGEVNLTAIQEYDEVQKRYDFLSEQKTDLEKSIKILEDAILKIDESTKTRFNETFEAVDKKFREIFPILFNGGKAQLMLTNPDNLLESGVDILVQPPGKRLQSISLLSGGEKALTAVSLVLSIFARKPSPFCLLDEVDAPLDDANVSRFNTVVRKMAEKTQFIVITHNKKTMEIAEALYGVTMERAGISKMASVRLNIVGHA
jgi:chromosome segregation protein